VKRDAAARARVSAQLQFGRKVLCVRRTATVATYENPSAGTVAINHPIADRTDRLK
jgi:hypothetical protein